MRRAISGAELRPRPMGPRAGVALMVALAVLATLIAMAVTFALAARVENRVGRNEAVADQARALAESRIEVCRDKLRRQAFSEFDIDANATATVAAEDQAWVRIEDEDAKFNLNGMGFPGDLGAIGDPRQRFTSFETSFVRLLVDRLAAAGMYANDNERRSVATAIATGIRVGGDWRQGVLEWRWGPDRAPGNSTAKPTWMFFEQSWGWAANSNAWGAADDNLGVSVGGWTYGAGDGYPSYYRDDLGVWYAENNVWGGWNGGLWLNDVGTLYPSNSTSAANLGYHDGMPSAIRHSDNTTASVFSAEVNIRRVDEASEHTLYDYDPENLITLPGNAPTDDRAYTTIYEAIPVIRHALEGWLMVNKSMSLKDANSQAWTDADQIFGLIEDYVTVSSHTRWAPRNDGRGGCVSISDWRWDRIDNDRDGIVDDIVSGDCTVSNETLDVTTNKQAYLLYLRQSLGLEPNDVTDASDPAYTVVSSSDATSPEKPLKRSQANQLVVNIVDFGDGDDLPTGFSDGAFSVYGAEGLHITQFMPTPAQRYSNSTGLELYNDGYGTDRVIGLGDGKGWDWDGAAPGHWVETDNGRNEGEWWFSGLKNGWYAIRIFGGQDNVLTIRDMNGGGGPVNVTCNRTDASLNHYYGYARSGGKLLAAQVFADTLKIKIAADQGAVFYGFQLLPQYAQITNIGMRSPMVSANHGVDVLSDPDPPYGAGKWRLAVTTANGVKEIGLNQAKYYNKTLGALEWTPYIAAASADGIFPVDYGVYVVAISEDAYARQWGAGNGFWGDEADEEYPVFFAGDASDDFADAMLIPASNVTVELRSPMTVAKPSGDLYAGGAADGLNGLNISGAVECASYEKSGDPLSRSWLCFTTNDTDLVSWQNRRLKVREDADYLQDAGSGEVIIRRCFNRNYSGALDAAPDDMASDALLKLPSNMSSNNLVFPIILNRGYASPGWLGLVPSGTPWRTLDPDPTPADLPAGPHEMLGRLMSRAMVGGCYARININSAPEPALKTIFGDNLCGVIIAWRNARPDRGWTSWDALLSDANFADYNSGGVGYWNNRIIENPAAPDANAPFAADAGSGSYGDDFPNSSDEKEEFWRRFSGVITIRSSAFKIVSKATVEQGAETGTARIEAIFDRERDIDADGVADGALRSLRYVTE